MYFRRLFNCLFFSQKSGIVLLLSFLFLSFQKIDAKNSFHSISLALLQEEVCFAKCCSSWLHHHQCPGEDSCANSEKLSPLEFTMCGVVYLFVGKTTFVICLPFLEVTKQIYIENWHQILLCNSFLFQHKTDVYFAVVTAIFKSADFETPHNANKIHVFFFFAKWPLLFENLHFWKESAGKNYSNLAGTTVQTLLCPFCSPLHKNISFSAGVTGTYLHGALLCRILNGSIPSPQNLLHISLLVGNLGVLLGFPFSGLSSLAGQ